jgi:hypothetical protein
LIGFVHKNNQYTNGGIIPTAWLRLSRNHAIETQRLLGLFAQGLRREALPDP